MIILLELEIIHHAVYMSRKERKHYCKSLHNFYIMFDICKEYPRGVTREVHENLSFLFFFFFFFFFFFVDSRNVQVTLIKSPYGARTILYIV